MGSIIDSACRWLIDLANDDTHGYDQINRWGDDYDCSSSTIQAFEIAGLKVKESGATYTGNMRKAFEKCGFTSIKYTKGMKILKGDVILNEKHHVVTCIDDNKNVCNASINEKGKATGGKTGDQTGREIYIRPFYEYSKGWDYVLRYNEPKIGNPYTVPTVLLKKNMVGDQVRWLQYELNEAGANLQIDSNFGSATEKALKQFQKAVGIEIDGKCGPITIAKLLENKTKVIGVEPEKPKNPYKHTKVTLKKGSKGESVRFVQWELNHRINANLQEDGSFGNLTKQKVIEFQKKVGLTPDGIVGPLTWKVLES